MNQELELVFLGKKNPEEYLRENTLGLLKLVRYAAENGQAVPASLRVAMEKEGKKKAPFSMSVAGEELERILMSDSPKELRVLRETDTLRLFLPELDSCYNLSQGNRYHRLCVGEHTLETIAHVPKRRELRWAALLHDLGKARTHTTDIYGQDHFHGHEKASARIAESVLDRLVVSDKDTIVTLVMEHDADIFEAEVPNWIEKLGPQNFFMLLQLKEADAYAKTKEVYERVNGELQHLRKIAENIKRG